MSPHHTIGRKAGALAMAGGARGTGRGNSGAGTRNVWLRLPSAAASEPPLSRERIVDAAVALLDEEGMDRLTMRRLGERLGAGATTLYWHVDTKDDVIDLAVDAIFAEAPLPAAGGVGAWREDVVALLSGCRAMLLRHPWSAALPLRRRPMLGPNFLSWMEFFQATLVRAGFRGQEVQAACWLLYSHVQGSTASQSSLCWPDEERAAAQERLRLSRDDYPTLVGGAYLMDDAWEENFRLGLEFVLDGLARRVGPGA
ncbi:TetR/AcrR family transcriptional regulator C-terminal domain-containing protein [Streptomyces sp. NPDC057638]|uniref:TetR/AcrR family transcriptional regulator C-terminal domain-containing protein n=1 Tax=Streptomyces sp. NPDC057638 TaxID=3346190 RepID=UPI00367E4DE9